VVQPFSFSFFSFQFFSFFFVTLSVPSVLSVVKNPPVLLSLNFDFQLFSSVCHALSGCDKSVINELVVAVILQSATLLL